MLDYTRFTQLTFDCYGTLIDWESGILTALHDLFARHGVQAEDAALLASYAKHESAAEAGEFRSYRHVLRSTLAGIAGEFQCPLDADQTDALADSLGNWPPFADSVESLALLKTRYRLAVLSNVDDALFAQTSKRLRDPFDQVITAQQLQCYKPAPRFFAQALAQLPAAPDAILHVAQSLYHDHVPAQAAGLSTVWIDRPRQCAGSGATPPADVQPSAQFNSLAELTQAMGL